jgi:hypothetical protein
VINPLRSEQEAFRFFVWALIVIGTITVLVLVLRAIL